MNVWEILVPTVVAGRPIPAREHRIWDQYVRNISHGLTIMPSVKGQWVSGDQLFCERMIPVRIACTREQIEAIADMTAAFYGQQAVMFYKVADEVTIKVYKPA